MGSLGFWQLVLILILGLYLYGYVYNYKLAKKYSRNAWLWVCCYSLIGPISTIILLLMGRTRVIEEGRGKRNWFVVGAATIFGIPILFFVIMGFLSSVGVMPANEVVSGGKIPNLQIQTLINNGILKNNETIELFYSEGFLSVAEGGQFLTPTK